MPNIRITRSTGNFAFLRSFKIFVNGKPAGRLRYDQMLTLEVDRGPVEIKAKMDWFASQVWTCTMENRDVDLDLQRTKGLDRALGQLLPFLPGRHALVLRLRDVTAPLREN